MFARDGKQISAPRIRSHRHAILFLAGIVLGLLPLVASAQLDDPNDGPGGPILVVTDNLNNPFTNYYAEILRAEGFNAFDVLELTAVNATVLADFAIVIVGEMPLSAAQVSMFETWVLAGGNLVVMRPDRTEPSLLTLLGLTDAGGTLEWGDPGRRYLLIDTAANPGAGLVGETIQYHGAADLYDLAGATQIAELYSDPTTPHGHPAVVWREFGASGGHVAAFTYDLARSVVLTRQGNPAWSGQDRDGDGRVRSNDPFVGDIRGVNDWIDLDKVAIPQADEQQRLLANLILEMNRDVMPLPRFWYFPNGFKAVLVMTMDSHGGPGYTLTRMQEHVDQSPPGCSLDNWECVRATNYLYTNDEITDAVAVTWDGLGFEFGLHVDTGCNTPWADIDALRAIYLSQHTAFRAKYVSIPNSISERGHCVTWADWASKPIVQTEWDVRIDCTYYYEGVAEWAINSHPGMYTGSGLPMRFANLDGTLIDAFQLTTQMTDESGQTYPFTVDAILDKAVGPEGYYGAFCLNMHSDNPPPWNGSVAAPLIVASAQARGVPVIASRQMLSWLDARDEAHFAALTWNDGTGTLSFSVVEDVSTLTLEGMLPILAGSGELTDIEYGGVPISYRTETIKGVTYAIFSAEAGDYTAQYDPDLDAPVIADLVHDVQQGGITTLTWTTDELADSRVDYGTDPGDLALAEISTALVTDHEIVLSGLAPNTTYYYTVTSEDAWGNSTTEPATGSYSFVTPAAVCFMDDITTDFASGDPGLDTQVAETGNGEVILRPAAGSEFSGTELPVTWETAEADPDGSVIVAGGVLSVDGYRVSTVDFFAAPTGDEVRSLEFVATFEAAPHQHLGFGNTLQEYPYAIFSTSTGGTALYAHTRIDAATGLSELLSASYLGAPHHYRIDWYADVVDYYIDGTLVAQHSYAITADLRPVIFERYTEAPYLTVDWLRMSPYSATGQFDSRVYDSAAPADWDMMTWLSDLPAGTSLDMYVRTGDTPTPDITWTSFVSVPASGTILGTTSQFIQYQVQMTTSEPWNSTPALEQTAVSCDAGEDLVPPFILNLTAIPDAGGSSATVTWDTNELADSVVEFGTAPDLLDQVVADATLVVGHSVDLNGLVAGTTYYYRATSADAASNSRTEPPVGSPAASFDTPTPPAPACLVDTTDEDFVLGDFGTSTAVAVMDDGEVILAPTVGEDFSGDTLPAGWEEWDSGGATTVSGGLLIIDGMRAGTTDLYSAPVGGEVRTIDFVATFQDVTNQHGGLGVAFGAEYQWAIFSTQSGGDLVARTRNGAALEDYSLGASYLGSEHRFRIDWRIDGVDFFIDGAPVHSSAVIPVDPMRPLMNDSNENDGIDLTVDWVHLSPYSLAGSYESHIYDSQAVTDWEQAIWLSDEPVGTSLDVYVHSGDTAVPDGTWTAYSLMASNGDIVGTTSRYVQYRADLATADPSETPVLEEMTITCFAGTDETPPLITGIDAIAGPTGTTATVSWLTDEPADSQVDYGIDPDNLLATEFDATLTTDHAIGLTGLSAGTTYYYQVTSADGSANATTEPAIPASFITPAPCTGDATASDFLAGTTTDTYIAETGDGEIMLAPIDGAEFFGTDIPPGTWEWIPRDGSYTVADGVVSIDGGSIGSTTRRSAGRSMEFVATFTTSTQHIGFGEIFNGPDFAIFTNDGSQLTARTLSDAGNMTTALGSSYLNEPHLYRIEWTATTVDYYIDGNPTSVATHSHNHANTLRFLAMDSAPSGAVLVLDWARVSPLEPAGTFTSRVFDSGEASEWLDLQWAGTTPSGTTVDFETRSGDTADSEDGSWYGWEPTVGSDVISPDARYVQYRVSLVSGDPEVTPVLEDVQICHLPADPCSGDTTPPDPIADLVAAKVLMDNDPGHTVQIDLTWPAVEAGATVSLYRKGFGNYPEYDDDPGAGSPPSAPADPDAALADAWTAVGDVVDLTAHTDLHPERDFWYYVAFVTDVCGNVSGHSNLTAGALNYHLGDVYDGATPGVGDNIVTTNDVTRLALGYGTVHSDPVDPNYRNFLDVGPLTEAGLPETDDMIQFEDLVIFAINFHSVGKELEAPLAVAENWLRLAPAPLPEMGETYTVELRMAGDGQIQGLSVPLQWDTAVLELLGAVPGELLARQGGQSLVLTPEPGVFDVALIGVRERGISGEGVLVELQFRVISGQDPAFALGVIDARSSRNEAVALEGEVAREIPQVTALHPNAPNPFNPRTRVSFDLAVGGEVTLKIYSVDGRLVRTLVSGHHEPGYYATDWNGTDDRDRRLASGVYLYRLVAPEKTLVRKMLLMK